MGWNKEAARIYGYDASEITDNRATSCTSPKRFCRARLWKFTARRTRRVMPLDSFAAAGRRDGISRAADITRRNNSQGNAIGYLVVSQDVTAEQRHFNEQHFLRRSARRYSFLGLCRNRRADCTVGGRISWGQLRHQSFEDE